MANICEMNSNRILFQITPHISSRPVTKSNTNRGDLVVAFLARGKMNGFSIETFKKNICVFISGPHPKVSGMETKFF